MAGTGKYRAFVIQISSPEEFMELILVSACLLGEQVRYDGGDKRCNSPILLRWMQEGRVISVCPEVAGGLPVPRAPAEIRAGAGGTAVLKGAAIVLDATGRDVSAQFLEGAEQSLNRARASRIRIAILKEGSPSCGTGYIYDGSFTGKKVAGAGVTAARLREAGVQVFSELKLEEADELLRRLERDPYGR
jgi:uncharacterized protein YbbK (DUF523 family)